MWLHLQLKMSWCTCPKIVVSLICGAVCLSVASDSNLIFGAAFFFSYAGIGILYNICKFCCKCCLSQQQNALQDNYVASNEPLVPHNYQPRYSLQPAEIPINHSTSPAQNNPRPERALRETFHQQECTVCLDGFQPGELAARLDCGHKFHQACIVDWLEKQLNCPVCRQVLQ